MIWFVIGSLLFLVLHRVAEGYYVTGPRAVRRRFFWEMGTAAVLAAAVLAALVLTFLSHAWRDRVGPVVLIGAPVALAALAAYSYLSYLVYTRDEDEDVTHEPVAR